jgi:glucose/arabinose dehydrogenase
VVHSNKQSFRIEVLAAGLEVPWGLAFLPDGRMLVTERSGSLRIIEDGQLLPDRVMGTPEVQVGQDGGLFDVAVHPDYLENGWIYLSYAGTLPGYVPPQQPQTTPSGRPILPPSMTVIVRGKLSENNQWIASQELFRAAPELHTTPGVHYGTRFAFDHDNHLFYSIGDRGNMENAQDLSTPLGKIHRIDDDGSVPDDNPFLGVAGALSTIWSYGHRNPQGLAFDPQTGLLWSSEHGPMGGDEINIIEPGNNYGWGVISMGLQPGITQYQAPGMEQPIVHYTPTLAPSGISFNSGNRYPGWSNSLFVAGLAGQQLRRLEIKGREVVEQEVLFDQFGRTRTAVFGGDGLLYVLLQNPTGSGTGLRLSEPTPGILVRLIPLNN